jgi:hypothetical protein
MGVQVVRLSQSGNWAPRELLDDPRSALRLGLAGDEGRERKVARIQLNYRPGVGLGQRGRGPESRLLDCDCANLHFPAAIATPNCGNLPIWGGFNFGHKHALTTA